MLHHRVADRDVEGVVVERRVVDLGLEEGRPVAHVRELTLGLVEQSSRLVDARVRAPIGKEGKELHAQPAEPASEVHEAFEPVETPDPGDEELQVVVVVVDEADASHVVVLVVPGLAAHSSPSGRVRTSDAHP